MLAAAVDSAVDSQLGRIRLDGAAPRWSIAPGQSGFRGPGWTVLEPVALVDTQDARGSDPLRPTLEVPSFRLGTLALAARAQTIR